MEEIIFISVNNWFCGRDYPPTENFKKWLGDDLNLKFKNDAWAKENKLCIYYGVIDMSQNFTISAPREWVEKNCPELLTDDEYTYYSIIRKPVKQGDGSYKYIEERVEHKENYSKFVYHPDEGETTPDCDYFDMPFREYREENFGSEYYECDDEDEE